MRCPVEVGALGRVAGDLPIDTGNQVATPGWQRKVGGEPVPQRILSRFATIGHIWL